MRRCNECNKWFDAPELRQPVNLQTGRVMWDEDYFELCPKCLGVLDGSEVVGEPCEWCEQPAAGDDGTCGVTECVTKGAKAMREAMRWEQR